MEAKEISQKTVKNMINSNTTLLHIGNFETGKRTNLKGTVNECIYASRWYYNTEIKSDSKILFKETAGAGEAHGADLPRSLPDIGNRGYCGHNRGGTSLRKEQRS